MDRLTRNHIINASATQLAGLLEVSSQLLYESIRQGRITMTMRRIEIGARNANMDVGDFVQGLTDWIKAKREQKEYGREIDQFLKQKNKSYRDRVK